MGRLDEDEDWEAIIWVDEYCRVLIQIYTHTSISASSSENGNWVKVFLVLMLHEEQEAPTYSIDDLMVQPSCMQLSPFCFYVYKKHHKNLSNYVYFLNKYHLMQDIFLNSFSW